MITLDHAVIRTADSDDAYAILQLYGGAPKAAYLNRKREIVLPTVDELRETLSSPKDPSSAQFLVVEDRSGEVRGFCALRGNPQQTAYGEILLLFDSYEAPECSEALGYLCRQAFQEKRMHKVITQCLEDETPLRDLLIANGFESNGVQRHVLYAQGCWYNLETFSLFAPRHEEAHAALG